MSNSLQPHGLYSPWNSPDQNTGMGSLSLLQGIFPTQGSKPGLPHCRPILYQLSHKGSPGSRPPIYSLSLTHDVPATRACSTWAALASFQFQLPKLSTASEAFYLLIFPSQMLFPRLLSGWLRLTLQIFTSWYPRLKQPFLAPDTFWHWPTDLHHNISSLTFYYIYCLSLSSSHSYL